MARRKHLRITKLRFSPVLNLLSFILAKWLSPILHVLIFSVAPTLTYVWFPDITLLWETKLFKFFFDVHINSLQFKFGLFNGISCVLVLAFKFSNLIELSIILVGTKACLSDKKSSLTSLLEDKLSKRFGGTILLSCIFFISSFLRS